MASNAIDPEMAAFVSYVTAAVLTGVYVVGSVGASGVAADSLWRVEKRRASDGALVWRQFIDAPSTVDRPMDVAVDEGGLYVVGVQRPTGSSSVDGRWRIERRTPDAGVLDWEHTVDPTAAGDRARGVAIGASGLLIVGEQGWDGSGAAWRVERRSPVDGARMWTRTYDPTASVERAVDAAVDPTGVYAVGRDASPGGARLVKRAPDGTLRWERTPASADDPWRPRAAAASPDGLFTAGEGTGALGDATWQIERREPDGTR